MKMMMNILGGGGGRGEIYANALIEKEKDDLTEGDQGESRGDTMMKKMMRNLFHLCWLRLISCPKVLLQSSQAKGLAPLWLLLV